MNSQEFNPATKAHLSVTAPIRHQETTIPVRRGPRLISRNSFLALLFALALLVRLAAILVLRDPHTGPQLEQMGADSIEFNKLALNAVQWHQYALEWNRPTSFRAPGFPLLLAGVYAIAGEQYPLAYLFFALLGAATCIVAYFLASEVLPEAWARLAGLLCALYLPHVYFATVFASETVFALTMAASVLFFVRYLKTSAMVQICLCGLALGWSDLTRPFIIVLLPMWIGIVICRKENLKTRFFGVAGLIAMFLLVTVPWTVRNYYAHHQLVAVATNGGSTFYGSNNDQVLKDPYLYGSWISTKDLPQRNIIEEATTEVDRDKIQWQLGLTWVQTHLRSLPRLCLFKFVRLWLPKINTGNRKYALMEIFGYSPLGLLFFVGFGLAIYDQRSHTACWAAIHAPILATIIMALVFNGNSRYRDANAALIVLYASSGLAVIVRSLNTYRSQPYAIPANRVERPA